MLSRVVCYCVLCVIEPTTYLVVFLKTESPAVVVVENFEESLSEHPVLRQNTHVKTYCYMLYVIVIVTC